MNLFADIRGAVIAALDTLIAEGQLPAGLDFANVAVEPPRDALHGDMATNAAMVLAKPAGLKPRDIAEALAAKLAADPRIAAAEVAGPGFLNLRLEPGVWAEVLRAALTAGPAFGRSTLGRGIRVNVEYVSANPTGPMHVGHWRPCWISRATMSRGNITSTTAARRSMCWRARPMSAIARPAGWNPRSARGCIPAIT